MKKTCTKLLVVLLLSLPVLKLSAQNNFFADAKESSFKIAGQTRVLIPEKYRTVSLDTTALLNFFSKVPNGKIVTDHNNVSVISLPMPNGKINRFHIWETPIMQPGLAAKFQNIKTYTGQGIDDKTATIKIDWTDGFHAMILSPLSGTIVMDPYARGTKVNYISYYKSDFKKKESFSETLISSTLSRPAMPDNILSGQCIGTQLRTYRLAVACTHQYADSATGLQNPTVTDAFNKIVISINRVNGIYEKELDISFVLVNNEDQIIFTNAGTDPFTGNNNASTLIVESQNIITSKIGSANFDIGHTFSTGAGGVTQLGGVVCLDDSKASSVTGLSHPVGDIYDVDYVAHEIGHEFGALHPFNSSLGFCVAGGQWFIESNDEPGSGSTIMAYAEGPAAGSSQSLCSTDNLQIHSDAYFNGINLDQIAGYSIFGAGNTCPVVTSTGNHIPVANAGADYTIPKATPFILTGSATDADPLDTLTYCWEQLDVGGKECKWNEPVTLTYGDAPLFRSFVPVSVPYRYFPQLSDVINNTTTIGEILPQYARTMHFRLTARDNVATGGGVCSDEDAVTVDVNSGPFQVTYPNATGINWNAGETRTVTWNSAGTQSSPVSCSNVSIQLSTDGGLTYPVTVLASTANNGSANIVVPNNATTKARIRIMAVGNVFYDISNNNFTINSSVATLWVSFAAVKQVDNTALLTWVINEQNTDHYEIQRSSDGVHFTTIGQIASANGNDMQKQYSFIDQDPLQAKNYYRIKEVGTAGDINYSKIDTLSFSAWSIITLSNDGLIHVISNVNASKVQLGLFDATGRLMYLKDYDQTTIGQNMSIPTGRFASGVYSLKIISSKGTKVQKILIQ